MPPTLYCPHCGNKIPENAPGGFCPRCLLQAGIQVEPHAIGSGPNDATDLHRHKPSVEPLSVAELQPRFPQLEIIELLGCGGMGAVYRVRQINLDRMVALKIIRPESSADPSFSARFNREAKTLARLSHPHIVAIYDFGEADPRAAESDSSQPLYYFLMEFVEGTNLRHLLHDQSLTPEQALAIVPQLCDALQFAHDQGVVHRDIKPENILIDKRGIVKIADFGIARLVHEPTEGDSLTGTHQVMGTPRYMAPEQLEYAHRVDHRADIFSLGVVFYEMLTGQLPIGSFEPPSKKVHVDVRLDAVVLRSLAREPDRRYQHASEVKTDIRLATTAPTEPPAIAQQPTSMSSPTLQELDELKRLQELAEIEPDWFAFLHLGLFAAGWIALALLWNWRFPGLVLTLIIMAVSTWYAIRLKLKYLPKLESELQRDSRLGILNRVATAGILFTLGLLCVIWFQVSLADVVTAGWTHRLPMGPLNENVIADEFKAAKASGFEVPEGDTSQLTSGYSLQSANILLSSAWALVSLFGSFMTMLHTRRYRYTWKYQIGPASEVLFWMLSTLVVVHFGHILLTGYSSSSTAKRTFASNLSSADVTSAIDSWMERKGYRLNSYNTAQINQEGTKVGELSTRIIAPSSWFDRYHMSWKHLVLRPQPEMRLTWIGNETRSQSFISLELPHHLKDSPELDWWNKFAIELESELQ